MHFNGARIPSISHTFGAKGGSIGPLVVEEERQVFSIRIVQKHIKNKAWSYVGLMVINQANGRMMVGFGREFWYEEGRDSEGYWREGDTHYATRFTLPKGTYTLQMDTEASNYGSVGTIWLRLTSIRGSTFPFIWIALLFLLLGLILLRKVKSEAMSIEAHRWRETWPTTPLAGKSIGPATGVEREHLLSLVKKVTVSIDFYPYIPLENLYGAYRQFGGNVDPRTIFAVGDATMFSWAKYGFYLTADHFVLCGAKCGRKVIRFDQVTAVEVGRYEESDGEDDSVTYRTLDVHYRGGQVLPFDSKQVDVVNLPNLAEYLTWKCKL
ncbi:MAG: hypothetical protein HQL53_12330, partial [Magnetococcales bacterium]|nr:hypothetical protein [Magnetococcales bacterium]